MTYQFRTRYDIYNFEASVLCADVLEVPDS